MNKKKLLCIIIFLSVYILDIFCIHTSKHLAIEINLEKISEKLQGSLVIDEVRPISGKIDELDENYLILNSNKHKFKYYFLDEILADNSYELLKGQEIRLYTLFNNIVFIDSINAPKIDFSVADDKSHINHNNSSNNSDTFKHDTIVLTKDEINNKLRFLDKDFKSLSKKIKRYNKYMDIEIIDEDKIKIDYTYYNYSPNQDISVSDLNTIIPEYKSREFSQNIVKTS